MASHPPARCCTIGVTHEGEAKGEIKSVANISSYVAYPEDKSTSKAILLLTDVIGHKFINAQLIADQFAANGYFVVVPDLFNGDSVPLNRPESFQIFEWRKNHSNEHVDPIVAPVIKALREEFGSQKIGGVGYCFGAKYVARFLKPGQLDVGYVAHPSFVEEDELRGIKGPLSIAAAQTDQVFPEEKRIQSEGILRTLEVPWQINLFSGTQHGFAVRGDIKDDNQRYAKEQAFVQAVDWFDRFFK